MRNILLLFSFLVVQFSSVILTHDTFYNVTPIERSDIQQAVLEVSWQLRVNTTQRVGFVGLSVGLLAGAVYYLQKSSNPAMVDHLPEQEQAIKLCIEANQLLTRVDKTLKYTNDAMKELQKKGIITGGVFSRLYWQQIFSQTLTTVFITSLIGQGFAPLVRYYKKFDNWFESRLANLFSQRTINWYAHQYIYIDQLLDEIERHLSARAFDSAYTDWRLLKHQVAQVVGFIVLQQNSIPAYKYLVKRRFNQINQKFIASFKQYCIAFESRLKNVDIEVLDGINFGAAFQTVLRECSLIEEMAF